jgi:uncharacterized protein YndB with AHSA1/START domain
MRQDASHGRDRRGPMTDISATVPVTINAEIEDVWNAITTPELLKRWFFGVDTESEWEVGSRLVHTGVWQGQPYEDRGVILEIEPPTLLVHTHWSPMSGRPDSRENYEEVTWQLAARDGVTELTITEENLPSEDAKVTSQRAWSAALDNLESLLEGPSKGTP